MAKKIVRLGGVLTVGSFNSDPSGYENGSMYYNTVSGKIRKLESGTWGDVGAVENSDSDFRIIDNGDGTKKMAFEVSGISTGTTRTVTMPDSNVNLGLIATAIQSSEKGANNGVATLDAGGKVPSSQIPPIALVDVSIVADNAARDALTVQEGDVAIVTSTGKTFIYDGSAWQEITAAGAVITVNGQTGTVSLDTDDIAEGSTNLYFTTTRARTAAVSNSITNGVTDVAPSQDAVFDALALKLANVSEDTTPTLGGDLDLDGKNLMGVEKRSAVGSPSSFIEEQYIHATTLTGSQTNAVASAFTFAHATYAGIEITYYLKEATTNRVRIGTLRVVTDGTDIGISDTSSESNDCDVTWDASINGANVELKYTTANANNKTMRADIKRFLV